MSSLSLKLCSCHTDEAKMYDYEGEKNDLKKKKFLNISLGNGTCILAFLYKGLFDFIAFKKSVLSLVKLLAYVF